MSIVRIRDKRIGVTYVYEQEKSVWDPVKKQARSKRTLIGKLDEKSGEIVPTANWGKNRKFSSDNERDYKKLYLETKVENEQLKKDYAALKLELALLKNK